MRRFLLNSAALAAIVALMGCEMGPDYTPPPVEVPTKFKESYGNWQPAKPDDEINRGEWWAIYKDPVLDKLEKQIDISNQNLKAAEAQWRQARAVVEGARASLFPTVSLDSSAIRSGSGAPKAKTITTYDLSAGASWVPDLWGRIRRTVESDIASAQASDADLALARLSAQAELATDFFTLRAQDDLKQLLDLTATSERKTLTIVKNQYEAGIAAKADVLTAQTQLEGVQAQAINVGVQRAQLEHAIAVLTGKPPAELTILASPLAKKIPPVPAGMPSQLLERRPDIAAAERQMAAANAQIGVAIAAWFPDLTLSGSAGYSGVQLGNLISSPNSLWSLGPALAETIFDAGAREAQEEEARALYDQSVANYRQSVLNGFQQVEDQLAALRILEQQAKLERQVVVDAHKAEELVVNQYKEGTVPFSSVLAAQITTLGNEQTALTVRLNRLIATVSLVEALGGGWNVADIAHDHPTPKPAPAVTDKMQTVKAPAPAAAPREPVEAASLDAIEASPASAARFNFQRSDEPPPRQTDAEAIDIKAIEIKLPF